MTISGVARSLPLFVRRFYAFSPGGGRLLAAAALLHVALAVGLFWAGRAQIAPNFIDRDGIMGSFAFDSYEYQQGAVRLAEVLRQGGIAAWAAESEPLHVRAISVSFALLGPLFGYGPLSAEPFNLICYLAVVALTLALGREIGGTRGGLIAAGVVALWPTFLLHTLQLLKDSLFIAGALALVLCVTTWLTRNYGPRGAFVTGALMSGVISLLLLVRGSFAVIIFALVLFGFVLLVVRQLVERRTLYWNMFCPLLILLAGVLLLSAHSTRGGRKFKHYPSDGGGQPKAVASAGVRVSTIVSYLHPVRPVDESHKTYVGRLHVAADRTARRIGSVRDRFNAVYSESGSNIDPAARFRNLRSLFLYLPRAFEIGCCAPFPSTWIGAGKRVGSAGKLLSGAETLVIYVFELLALAALLRPPHRLASGLLLSITVFGVTMLGLVISNVGALYRFRYTFWVLLIILGAKGFEAVVGWSGRWRGAGRRGRLPKAAVASLCLLVTASSSCALRDNSSVGSGADARLQAQGAWPVVTVEGDGNASAGGLGFDLVNFTGSGLRAVYISRSDSKGWEENVLGESELADGDTTNINFSTEEKAALWDIRVEGADGHYAEWKALNLRGASRITLLLDLVVELTVAAEIE